MNRSMIAVHHAVYLCRLPGICKLINHLLLICFVCENLAAAVSFGDIWDKDAAFNFFYNR